METIGTYFKNFFNLENFKFIWTKIYDWLGITLKTIFGKIPYTPIRDLLTNPWFWIILLVLLLLGIIFRRR
jgi:hypothetical protein